MKTDKADSQDLVRAQKTDFVVPFFPQILECPNACFPHIWRRCFVEQYEDIWVKASGSTLWVAEKYALIGTRITF